ncbi:hypothetical protein [Streptomyces bambusae]|uniref:Uncharacterized protein n=1 Tax=Streptomyces bambusae TaxID=1550616 RepID=A0ABS6Z6G3_9ACTN|nr:hypothetical protein [Streptomyces bambusae]MBW5482300.1 hypothetical protein [Streptomyces bambusae]
MPEHPAPAPVRTGALDDDGKTVLAPPEADISVGLRGCLHHAHHPHHNQEMHRLTGLDKTAHEHALTAPTPSCSHRTPCSLSTW